MVELGSLPPHLQANQFHQGDSVHYIGTDPKIQQDYGNQKLRIVAIDVMSKIAVCQNTAGIYLVGVSCRDLQRSW